MKATVLHGAGDVRVEEVPDTPIIEPTDAVIRIYRACICGSDRGAELAAHAPAKRLGEGQHVRQRIWNEEPSDRSCGDRTLLPG